MSEAQDTEEKQQTAGKEAPPPQLRFAPDILKRLGEELIPHPEQGIIELVRNAYDADATGCTVELQDIEKVGGRVTIIDDGAGMTASDIKDGWLVLGKSRKAAITISPRGRRAVGDKGLGRLAGLRLGKNVILRTRPEKEPGVEFKVDIDWRAFDSAKVVEDVPLPINKQNTSCPHGTTIEIQDVQIGLNEKDVERLARSLLLLSDPFDSKASFRPTLRAPNFGRLEKIVRGAYFDVAEFHLDAKLKDGVASAVVTDRIKKVRWQAAHKDIAGEKKEKYDAPDATFQLWIFLLGKGFFSTANARLPDVKRWLSEVGGVHLYHRGLRAYPYGEQGHDWLEMNLERTSNPELRPSTATAVGRVIVEDPNDELLQKTDRSGFVESAAFDDLRQFAKDALNWLADERLKAREKQRQSQSRKAPRAAAKARQSLKKAVQKLPKAARSKIEQAVATLENAQKRVVSDLQEEVALYRTLGTVGTTVAVFAHDSGKPVSRIAQTAASIETQGKKKLGDKYEGWLSDRVEVIKKAADALQTYARLPITLLKRDKRRIGRLRVHEVIENILALFAPFFDSMQIHPDRRFVDADPIVKGRPAALEAILSNLFTNALTALTAPDPKITERNLVVRTDITSTVMTVRVLDSGPGIAGIDLDDIWLPGKTTTPGGTGLGLTIVRDASRELGGEASAVAHGELGGAEFAITLPLESS